MVTRFLTITLILLTSYPLQAVLRPATKNEIDAHLGIVLRETTARPPVLIRRTKPSVAESVWDAFEVSVSQELKLYDTCAAWYSGTDNAVPPRGTTLTHRCQDGTFSFTQPSPTVESEGRCGQTSISTVLANVCSRGIDPRKVVRYTHDATPGIRPATLVRALNRFFAEGGGCPSGQWSASRLLLTNYQYIEAIRRGLEQRETAVRRGTNGPDRYTPVVTLLGIGFKLHWSVVTALTANRNDHFGCSAVINTWGGQYRVSCEKLARLGNTILGFSVISFE